MIHFYKIQDIQWAEQSLDDIQENEGLALWKITIKSNVAEIPKAEDPFFEGDGEYDPGWPLMFSSTDDWGFRSFEIAEHFYEELSRKEGITRRLYVLLEPSTPLKKNDWLVFANQYEYRVSNEELREVLNELKSSDSDAYDITYSINKDNKLQRND